MKFLLNSKIKIFSLSLEQTGDGGFNEKESYLGSFYCHARLNQAEEEQSLVLIIREHKDVKGRLKIVFQDKTYIVCSITSITTGFLKLLCK